ncbi:hypothetical protein ACN47E_000894 [Coniothyrium glycines]
MAVLTMSRFWPFFLLASGSAAWAQAPAGTSDPAALQRALDKLNGRLEQLEKENKRLKAQPPASVTPAIAPGTAGPKAPAKSVPGWFVYLIPYLEDGSSVPVGGFPGPLSEFNFDMHSQYVPGQNRFTYYGKSYLRVLEDANYTFSVTLDPVTASYNTYNYQVSFNCASELRVNDKPVVTGATSFGATSSSDGKDLFRSQTFFGQTRLIPEPDKGFAVEFKVDCWPANEKNVSYFDRYLTAWKKNRFKIMVKTPKDTVPRPFLPNELYYVGQP